MTLLTLHLAAQNWLAVHQALHGPLTPDEHALTKELIEFLGNVTRAEEMEVLP